MMFASDIFQSKGYIPYISQDFYSKNTFIVKQGRNAEHINSTVNGKNSGWPNAAHIVLPIESRYINVISEAHQGTILSYLASKFNELRNETFIYQPCVGNSNYQRFKIWLNQFNQCVITKDGEPGILNSIVPNFETEIEQPTMPSSSIVDVQKENKISTPYSIPPRQIIYYGVPGCGKSYKVEEDICEAIRTYNNNAIDKISYEKHVTRVVFHPDYSNVDFIGQVVPSLDSQSHVMFKFKAGPFSQVLRKAYLNPSKPYFLIIEEINRGNAAAIFGDVFQLLDRFKTKGHSKDFLINSENFDYTQGWSKYAVTNDDINGFVRQGAKLKDSEYECVVYDSDFSDDLEAAIKIPGWGNLHFSINTGIRLPPNLSILATMNTSDQNVFTLDNAFKRRFDSELIKNTLAGDEHKVQRETKIEGTSVTWGEFWEKINNLILEKNASMTSTEDKRLGAYFIVGDEKTDAAGNKYREVSKKLFGEKVLEYLWNDAFKFKHKDIFKEDCKSAESLIENFEEGGFAAVFKNDEFTTATAQDPDSTGN